MHRRDKPFVVFRRDFLSYKVVPRGPRGWLHVALLLAIPVPMLVWIFDLATIYAIEESVATLVLLVIALLAFWMIGGIWWISAHAEVRDWSEYRRDKQVREQKRRKRD